TIKYPPPAKPHRTTYVTTKQQKPTVDYIDLKVYPKIRDNTSVNISICIMTTKKVPTKYKMIIIGTRFSVKLPIRLIPPMITTAMRNIIITHVNDGEMLKISLTDNAREYPCTIILAPTSTIIAMANHTPNHFMPSPLVM